MDYSFLHKLLELTEEFEGLQLGKSMTLINFSRWLADKVENNYDTNSGPDWDGKEKGRSADSIINTSFLHLYRYAKTYSKLALQNSPFSTIDEVIFLINLRHHGNLTKKELIDMNLHEKSTGIQIINRLVLAGFVSEKSNENDRRSKFLAITPEGEVALEANMGKIRAASKTVAGDLTDFEKHQLIYLLQKLEFYHKKKVKEVSSFD